MIHLTSASRSTWTSALALSVGALTMMFGIQFLRLLFVDMAVYLNQVQGLNALLVGAIGLAVFLSAFLEPFVRRALGSRNALPVVVGGLAVVRLAEQFVSAPSVDLAVSIIGTVLFLWSLPLLFRSVLGEAKHGSGVHATVAFLLGLSLDTAAKGVFGTVDLSWVGGSGAHIVMVLLVIAQGFLLWLLMSSRSQEKDEGRVGYALPYLAFGPALMLEMLLFQNIAHQTVLIGWDQPAVYALVLAASLIAVAVSVEVARWDRFPSWPILVLLGGLLVAMVSTEQIGALAVLILVAGQVAMSVTLVSATKLVPESSAGSVSAWMGVGMVALLLLLFLYYAGYDTGVLVPQKVVSPLAALLIGLAAVRACSTGRPSGVRISRFASLAVLLLLALPLVHLANWQGVEPEEGSGFPVRVMSYNLHQGFDTHGRHSVNELAEVIEAEQPDIVALQEVSRGWVINGSVDVLVWLSQRLGMDYVWGPATDSVWGNAVISRFPIKEFRNHEMPNNDTLRFDRGFVTLEVDLGRGETLDVIATHFHAGDADSAIRVPQARAVIEAIASGRPTVVLGDLNGPPHAPEIQMLTSAGLSDAFVSSGAAGGGYTFPADTPSKRIDYIWSSSDLKARDFSLPDSLASDHLAVVATLYRRLGRPRRF